MNVTRALEPFRPRVSVGSVALILGLTAAIAACEALLFRGYALAAVSAYTALLLGISVTALFAESDVPVLQAFVLLPLFRLVNLTIPVVVEPTLLWLPVVYGPFVPVFVYLGRQATIDDPEQLRRVTRSRPGELGVAHELPWWLGGNRGGRFRASLRRLGRFLAPPDGDVSLRRAAVHWGSRGLSLALLPLAVVALLAALAAVVAALAEVEYDVLAPAPLISSLEWYPLAVLTATMVAVGFVEELLFRGVLQKVLERRLGPVPGILLASSAFAVMYSGYGTASAIALAGGVGLLFGVIYDVTDSLVLVSAMHALLNVLLFGVVPLQGGTPLDVLRAMTG